MSHSSNVKNLNFLIASIVFPRLTKKCRLIFKTNGTLKWSYLICQKILKLSEFVIRVNTVHFKNQIWLKKISVIDRALACRLHTGWNHSNPVATRLKKYWALRIFKIWKFFISLRLSAEEENYKLKRITNWKTIKTNYRE